jgi:sugar lactone lactonase YvrE
MLIPSTAHAAWRRALLSLIATAVALAVLTVPVTAAPAHSRHGSTYKITIDGSRVFPESVAADSHYVYATSMNDGTVYRARPGAKTLNPFLAGRQDGRTQATGIKIAGNRLLVSGGFTGRFFIYTNTGKLVSAYTVPNTGKKTLVNDEAVTPNGDVYITDSFRNVLYRIPAAEVNTPATGAQQTLQVPYHLPHYVAGQSNANGIVATADGKSLIIGYWYSGALYRLTLATGEIRKIAGPPLHSADGIVRRGSTLYIARSVNNEISTVRLSSDNARATVVSERTYPGADTLTGIAVSGDRLLVSNSQFDTYLYKAPLTSPVFTLESLPLH